MLSKDVDVVGGMVREKSEDVESRDVSSTPKFIENYKGYTITTWPVIGYSAVKEMESSRDVVTGRSVEEVKRKIDSKG